MRATQMGRNVVHELNRDHVAADVAVLLAGLRTRLWDRLRAELEGWPIRPLFAAVFGSAARADGDSDSDIDVILVHPPLPGEKPARVSASMRSAIADALGRATLATDRDAAQWEAQLDRLRERVEAWTGNSLQIVDLTFSDWRRPPASYRALLDEVGRDGVELRGSRGLSHDA